MTNYCRLIKEERLATWRIQLLFGVSKSLKFENPNFRKVKLDKKKAPIQMMNEIKHAEYYILSLLSLL